MEKEQLKELKENFFKNIEKGENIKNIIEGMNEYFENCEDINDDTIKILQNINKYFLKKYEIHIDENLIIRPIETEIYFANSNGRLDGMCHMNELQKDKDKSGKDRFGKLYFHRYKNSSIINLCRGGVDVCISQGNYYLSILIRCAYINDTLFGGVNKILKGILDIKQGTKDLESKYVLSRQDKEKYKYKYKYFIYQNRIINGKYSIDGMPLNIIINDKEIFEKIDKNEDKIDKNKGSISSSVRTHYRYIKAKDFESEKNILISLSLNSIL